VKDLSRGLTFFWNYDQKTVTVSGNTGGISLIGAKIIWEKGSSENCVRSEADRMPDEVKRHLKTLDWSGVNLDGSDQTNLLFAYIAGQLPASRGYILETIHGLQENGIGEYHLRDPYSAHNMSPSTIFSLQYNTEMTLPFPVRTLVSSAFPWCGHISDV